jgi:hypothetical protein
LQYFFNNLTGLNQKPIEFIRAIESYQTYIKKEKKKHQLGIVKQEYFDKLYKSFNSFTKLEKTKDITFPKALFEVFDLQIGLEGKPQALEPVSQAKRTLIWCFCSKSFNFSFILVSIFLIIIKGQISK